MLKTFCLNTQCLMGLVFLLIPFYYYYLFGVRIILISVFVVLVVCVLDGISVKKSPDFLLFIVNVLIIFFLSCYSGNNSEFFAAFVFLLLMYWPDFVREFKVDERVVSKYINFYLYSAVFCAFSVIIQSYIYQNLGLEFGKIDTYLNRIAFGFVWLDYSFLSLFLVSAIPLTFRECGKVKYAISLLLIFASITTTARTGVFSLVLAMLVFSLIGFFCSLLKAKVKKIDFIVVAFLLLLIISVLLIWLNFGSRELTLRDSGRFEGYYNAFMIFLDSPYVGYQFDIEGYKKLYGTIPHNIFLYVITFGGLLGGGGFILWSVLLFVRLLRCDYFIKLSLLTVLIGFQFIPSYYSGYFFATLVSIAILNLKINITHYE